MSNIFLRTAILQSEKKNFEIEKKVRVHPTNLSQLISNKYPPTIKQKQGLPNVLQRAMNDLFKDRLQEVA
jgi:hypothetical protein